MAKRVREKRFAIFNAQQRSSDAHGRIFRPGNEKGVGVGGRLVVVGNAPTPGGREVTDETETSRLSHFIDEADCVVRFNSVRNQDEGWTGRRTDILYIRGQGRPARQFGETAIRFEGVDRPKHVIVVVDLYGYQRPGQDVYAGGDFTGEIVARNCFRSFAKLDATTLATARRLVRRYGRRMTPSLGFIALVHLLGTRRFANYERYVCAFVFEGWRGHPWAEEQEVVRGWIGAGRLAWLS